ncbi:MAG TPA: DUF4105 domain-containing protein [Candidatus Binatia bacterium]|nr:DUF4105 domain-containing protein [Candidatus Binatia bacterium]
MRRIWAWWLLAAAIGIPHTGHAGLPGLAQAGGVKHVAEAHELWTHPTWLALLSYRPRRFSGGWESQADDPRFFLSQRGRTDPHAELSAAVDAFFATPDAREYHADSPRCRFPARFTWLQRELGRDRPVFVVQQCAELRAWYETVASDSVSIQFASSYLERPQSMFGHTFLRLDRSHTPRLMAPTANYAADSSHDTGRVAFVARGLFGGFPGVVDLLPYFRRVRVYGDDEGRDMWEYPLRLSREQIHMLLLHLWEIRDGVFDYYFLGENCSYRTLALIAVAASDPGLLRGFSLEVAPIETIKALRERGLVGQARYVPSSRRALLWHARDFSAPERRLVVDIATGRRPPADLEELPVQQRARILAAAAELSSLLINRGELELGERDIVTQALIRERLRLNSPLPQDPPPVPPAPDGAHGGRMISVGWARRGGTDGFELGLAGFRHQITDPIAGYEVGAEVVMLRGRYRFSEGGRDSLEDLDIVRLGSAPPSSRFFRQPAWSFELGSERKHVDRRRPLVATLAYGHGYAIDTPAGIAAAKLIGSLDASPLLRGRVAVELAARLELTRQWQRLAYQAFAEHGRYVAGDRSHRYAYGIRLGLPLPSQLAVEIEAQRGGARTAENQLRLELKRFF